MHHVTANTDNLNAGIQTCRSTGTLLQKAIASIQDARLRLGQAGTDASTCLKIAQLYRRNQQLANMMEACSHSLTLQQKSADAECAPTPHPTDCSAASATLPCPWFAATLLLSMLHNITTEAVVSPKNSSRLQLHP